MASPAAMAAVAVVLLLLPRRCGLASCHRRVVAITVPVHVLIVLRGETAIVKTLEVLATVVAAAAAVAAGEVGGEGL